MHPLFFTDGAGMSVWKMMDKFHTSPFENMNGLAHGDTRSHVVLSLVLSIIMRGQRTAPIKRLQAISQMFENSLLMSRWQSVRRACSSSKADLAAADILTAWEAAATALSNESEMCLRTARPLMKTLSRQWATAHEHTIKTMGNHS
jgi:hypothetical protein